MAAIAALGERVLIEGYALAGVAVLPAEDAAAVRHAWATLDPDIAVVILTRAAAWVLRPERARDRPLTVVMPP